MKKLIIKLFCLCLLSVVVSSRAAAGYFSKDKVGTTGASFLKLGKGVRATGMGEAYCGVSDDVDAAYWNPAGLNDIDRIEIAAMHSVWFQDIYFDYISAALPGKRSAYGFSASFLGMEKIDKYYNTGEAAGSSYSPYDLLLMLSYARKYGKNLAGINLKYIRSVIDDDSANSAAADLGYLRTFMEGRLRTGANIQNLGTRIKFRDESDPLPLNIKTGVSYSGMLAGLTTALDLNFPVDNTPSLHLGAEYRHLISRVELAARTGYKTTTVEDLEPLAGFSAGFGCSYLDFTLDYAWVPYGKLGNTHRVSLKYSFGRTVKKDEEKAVPVIRKKEEAVKKDLSPEEKMALMKEYFRRGHELFQKREYAEAVAEFSKVLQLQPDHAPSIRYIQRAEEAIMKGKNQKLTDKELKMINMREHFMKGHEYFKHGNYGEAIEEFRKVLQYDPEHPESKEYIRRAEKELEKQ